MGIMCGSVVTPFENTAKVVARRHGLHVDDLDGVAVKVANSCSRWGLTAVEAQARSHARTAWMRSVIIVFDVQPRFCGESRVVEFDYYSRGRGGEDQCRELDRLKRMGNLADLQHWLAGLLVVTATSVGEGFALLASRLGIPPWDSKGNGSNRRSLLAVGDQEAKTEGCEDGRVEG